jgi:formimidoylglutamate deiminase
LVQQQRAVLDQIDGRPIAARLFECATVHGAQALGVESGSLRPGEYGDMISVDLSEISIAGNTPETLLPLLVFGANRSAIRDVVVNGRIILQEGYHPLQQEIIQKYREVYRKVWGQKTASGSIR